MAEDERPQHAFDGVLLMRSWSDAEAELVRQILRNAGIPCRVSSDVPHAVLPLNVDGLGEIRLSVPPSELKRAQQLLAEHRREGLELVDGDLPDEETE